ncbi:unnamed protein product [Musa acuminata subsp. burmannicoides]
MEPMQFTLLSCRIHVQCSDVPQYKRSIPPWLVWFISDERSSRSPLFNI